MHRLIEHNAKLVTELHQRVHEEFRARPNSPAHRDACKEFHERYDGLAFPGGYESCLARLKEGDLATIEAALVFLEVRPYFFRSQYMMTKLTRLLNHATLSVGQRERFEKLRLKKAKKSRTQSILLRRSAKRDAG